VEYADQIVLRVQDNLRRETQSPTDAMSDLENDPVPGLKTSSCSWGTLGSVEVSLRLVLTAAKTLPLVSACSVLRLMWSSGCPLP
jgi:hypothetical protein